MARARRTPLIPQPWPDRTWVPPTVAHLLWLSLAVLLVIPGSWVSNIGQSGGMDVGGRFIEATPVDVAFLGILVLPLTLPLWGAASFLLYRSTLWSARLKLAAIWLPLLGGLLIGVLPALGLALGGRSMMLSMVGVAIVMILLLGGWVILRIWKRGTASARSRAGLPA